MLKVERDQHEAMERIEDELRDYREEQLHDALEDARTGALYEARTRLQGGSGAQFSGLAEQLYAEYAERAREEVEGLVEARREELLKRLSGE